MVYTIYSTWSTTGGI